MSRLDLVVVGHVDHGKSTVVGRLLADTGALPIGKLEEVKARCLASARPFEYAFLLDALKAEQSQGITIDAARCFFQTEHRQVILSDAPGHIEFLKNMITGAARAQAALLVIDAKEGIRENSRRHGYLLSLLGIKQVAILINKMDLVGFRQDAFEALKTEYAAFLERLGVHAVSFLPIAALSGANIASRAPELSWYQGKTVLEQIDTFEPGQDRSHLPFRMGVQDIYKFTEGNDERRIIAGTVESGSLRAGDTVVFWPSGKRSVVASLEAFNAPKPKVFSADQSVGFTMQTQIYIRPGELASRTDEPAPQVATHLRATVFWMGQAPLVPGKRYKLKLAANRVPVELVRVLSLVNTDSLATVAGSQKVQRHEIAEVELATLRPVAYDPADSDERTARFVLVDDTDIAGCGVILSGRHDDESSPDAQQAKRAKIWQRSLVDVPTRKKALGTSAGSLILFASEDETKGLHERAQQVEAKLFAATHPTALISLADLPGPLPQVGSLEREERVEILVDLAQALTRAGILVIAVLPSAERDEVERLRRVVPAADFLLVQPQGEGEDEDLAPDLRLGENPAKDSEAIETWLQKKPK